MLQPLKKFLILLLLASLASCIPIKPNLSVQPWLYTDLLRLDAADSPKPTLDLLALYHRKVQDGWQVRLDFLDLALRPDFDLYLALDTQPGGYKQPGGSAQPPIAGESTHAWDTLIAIPASGEIQAFALSETGDTRIERASLGLLVARDPSLDTITIQLDSLALNRGAQKTSPNPASTIVAYVTQPNTTAIVDAIGPARITDPSPPPAQILLAFWDSFPAYTPAQALRRWDGAHTGPYGGRHGLYNLLRTARAAQFPHFLLDLNTPEALSALDAKGDLPMVQAMLQAQLLALPQTLLGPPDPDAESGRIPLPPWASLRGWQEGRAIAGGFGIPPSPFLFSPAGIGPVEQLSEQSIRLDGRVIFIPGSATGTSPQDWLLNITPWGPSRVIAVPGYGEPSPDFQQPGLEGLPLELRRLVVETALLIGSSSDGSFLLIGGSLPDSGWGSPQVARAAFHYLSSRPWIKPLSAMDLLALGPSEASNALSTGQFLASPAENSQTGSCQDQLVADLEKAPENPLGEAAWQSYRSAFAIVHPHSESLESLRLNYLGEVGTLLAAAGWAETPSAIYTCATDPDRDGAEECILASPTAYTQYELDGSGYLSHMFVRTEAGEVHQIVGPSSQVISGTSDPATWDLSAGWRADPEVIPGGFIEPVLTSGKRASGSLQDGGLVLTSADPARPGQSLEKTFRLLPAGIQVEYGGFSNPGAVPVRIPLLVDPWMRFLPGWADEYKFWSIPQAAPPPAEYSIFNFRVILDTSASLALDTFKDSQSMMNAPEDPNREATPGHYLPYPIALVNLTSTGDFTVRLIVERP